MKYIPRNPLIILIAGKAQSGKSTLAKELKTIYQHQHKKVILSPYTKYLKQYIEEITGEKIIENNKPRDLLQQLSRELIKDKLNKPNFFINRQIEDIEIYSYFIDVIIIPDTRFKEELISIKKQFNNVITIGITRQDYQSTLTQEQQQDITETSLDHYHNFDFEVINTATTNLATIAQDIAQQINNQIK